LATQVNLTDYFCSGKVDFLAAMLKGLQEKLPLTTSSQNNDCTRTVLNIIAVLT